MRDIKFRVWDKRETKGTSTRIMLYGVESNDQWQDFINYPKVYELMQYTGLTDKNGKEIYEGDIVKVKYVKYVNPLDTDNKPINYVTFIVKFGTFYNSYPRYLIGPLFYYDCSSKSGSCSFMIHEDEREVIGNIFENPELAPWLNEK